MDAKPIIFSGEMVRAILDGHKTQTRRVIKPQFNQTWGAGVRNQDPDYFSVHVDIKEPDGEWRWLRCPYGKAGDTLWVRETWGIFCESWTDYGWEGDGIVDIPIPKSRPLGSMHSKYHVVYKESGYEADDGERWRPSIFMPKWASRITLEITNVRVERIQEISEADAMAEGVTIPDHERGTVRLAGGGAPVLRTSYASKFRNLWDSINGKREGCSWADNPFCWAVTFRRVQPTAD